MAILTAALAALVVALSTFDALSTRQAMKRGAREANPVMAWVQRLSPKGWPYIRLGFGIAVAAAGIIAGGTGGLILMALASAAWGYAVWNNYSIAWKKQEQL